MEKIIEKLHEKRKLVDGAIQSVGELKLAPNSEQPFLGVGNVQREVALAYTKLQEAKMWLGKALEIVGNELPVEFQDKSE